MRLRLGWGSLSRSGYRLRTSCRIRTGNHPDANSLAKLVCWCDVERIFHLFKDEPLGIRPLFVRRDDQVQGLTHLVTLALRVLTLFEVLVRRGQEQSGEKLNGLYPGLPERTTDRPTGERVLEAISKAEITRTQVESGDGCRLASQITTGTSGAGHWTTWGSPRTYTHG